MHHIRKGGTIKNPILIRLPKLNCIIVHGITHNILSTIFFPSFYGDLTFSSQCCQMKMQTEHKSSRAGQSIPVIYCRQ